MTFLGIRLDTNAFSPFLMKKSLHVKSCLVIGCAKTTATKKQIQSLLGTLSHISTCVRPGRTFLNRMLNTLRSFPHDVNSLALDADFHQDTYWWKHFAEDFNGISIMSEIQWSDPDAVFSTDASSWGFGGFASGDFFHVQTPPHMESLHINHRELWAVIIALRLWGSHFAGKRIIVQCDNMCSVDVITSSKARVAFLQQCLREIRYLEAMYSFQISARHIAGVHNRKSDYLSRWGMSPDNPRLFHELTSGYNLCEYHVPPDMFHFTHQW